MPKTSATVKKSPGRPRDALLPERRKEEILDAAAMVFAEHGYRNTDVDFVAQAVHIAKGTIYRYFPSKEKLFLAAAQRGMLRVCQFVDKEAGGESNPLERMAQSIRAYLTFFRENPQYVELFIQERAEFRDRPQQTYFTYRDQRMAPWREIFRSLIKEGRVRDFAPERIVSVLCNVVYGTMFTNYFTGRQEPPEEQAEDIMKIILNGLLVEPNANNTKTKRHGASK